MANSYTVTPSIVPGNLSVGGNLDVKGAVLVGAYTARLRLFASAATEGDITFNLGTDQSTQDDTGHSSTDVRLGSNVGLSGVRYVKAGGGSKDSSLSTTIFTDYTTHTHTGDTTADTIYTTTVPGGVLGNNGGVRLRFRFQPTVQGATASTLRILWGGLAVTLVSIISTNATHNFCVDMLLGNSNSASAQNQSTEVTIDGSSPTVYMTSPGVNTANDQSIAITMQNGSSSDTQVFELCEVELLNTNAMS